MNEQFTKAPWTVNKTGLHWNNPALENIEITHGEEGECICDTVYEEADAHLIAAAPEMHDALSSIIECWDGPLYKHEMLPSIEKARKALAKARGEHDIQNTK